MVDRHPEKKGLRAVGSHPAESLRHFSTSPNPASRAGLVEKEDEDDQHKAG